MNTIYLVDGKPHRICDCPKLEGKCPRGVERSLQTTQLSQCFVPAPDVLIAGSAVPEVARIDPGTEKILWNLLDRAYKMMLMAIGPVHEQDPDSNDPIVAWASDVRKVLYGSGRVPSLADLQSLPSPLARREEK